MHKTEYVVVLGDSSGVSHRNRECGLEGSEDRTESQVRRAFGGISDLQCCVESLRCALK